MRSISAFLNPFDDPSLSNWTERCPLSMDFLTYCSFSIWRRNSCKFPRSCRVLQSALSPLPGHFTISRWTWEIYKIQNIAPTSFKSKQCETAMQLLLLLFSRMMQTIPSLNRSVHLNTPFYVKWTFFKNDGDFAGAKSRKMTLLEKWRHSPWRGGRRAQLLGLKIFTNLSLKSQLLKWSMAKTK